MPQLPSSVSEAFGLGGDVISASIIAEGTGGFHSDVKIQEKQVYDSIVPDIPIEDGSYINDHIILKPVILEVVGRVQPYYIEQQSEKFTSRPSQIVNTLSGFLPRKTAFQLQQVRNNVINIIDTADSYLSGFNNIFAFFKGDKTDLMQIFNDFMVEIRNKKILVDIKMPFKTHKNMIITNFFITTNNEGNALDYEFTAKNIVVATSKFTENIFNKGVRVENNGLLTPKDVSLDVCKNILLKGEACK